MNNPVRHTPGPWLQSSDHIYSPGEKGANVCTVSEPRHSSMVSFSVLSIGSPDFNEAMANARLIAAAPDLLAALIDCAMVMERELKGLAVIQPELRNARAAIAKAGSPPVEQISL